MKQISVSSTMKSISNFNSKLPIRCIVLLIFIVSLLIVFMKCNIQRNSDIVEIVKYVKSRMEEECFHYHIYDNRTFLPNILEHSKQPNENSKNIFFHETSCINDGVVKLNARQACAIESAARVNPDWEVFVLFVSRVGFNNKTRLPLFDELASYPNINLRRIQLNSYARNTPLDDWIHDGHIFDSEYFNSHLSDVLRLLSLWKYGGMYIDLDMVVRKSFNSIKPNFAGVELKDYITNSVMSANKDDIGRFVLDLCLSDLLANYNGHIWINNGPGLITRVLQKVCNTMYSKNMIEENCHGFRAVPPNVFFPVHYSIFNILFTEDNFAETMSMVNNSILVHIWNKLSKSTTVQVGANVPYGALADQFCPNVYHNCGKYF